MKMRTMSGGFQGAVMALTLALVLGACYEHTYTTGTGAPNGAVVYDEWRHHWLGGLISPKQELELRDVCPSGNATIHQEVTFLNGLIAGLTVGIYEPSTVEVRCADGRRSDLEFSSEDVEGMVLDPAFLEWVEATLPDRLEDVRSALQAAQLR